MNATKAVTVDERIRRYLDKLEAPRRSVDDPQDSHTIVFNATRALIHGFNLSKEQARGFLEEFLRRSDLPWLPNEITHKLQQVDAAPAQYKRVPCARGYLLDGSDFIPAKEFRRVAPVEFRKPSEMDLAELNRLAGSWAQTVDLVWLANRSALDPATVTAAGFLEAMYEPGEHVVVFTEQRSQGQALWPDDPLPSRGADGVWFLPQPVDGATYPNPRTEKMSRRSEEAVREFRYLVLESDAAPARPWLGLLAQLPARIEAIYTSGGRSVHALVRVGCRSKAEWDAERSRLHAALGMLFLGGLDRGVLSAVRLSRLPGCWRASKRGWQKLLYVQPGADMRPICERPAVRDVEQLWGEKAALGISDADETGGAVLKHALEFYGTVSDPLRAALDSLKERAA